MTQLTYETESKRLDDLHLQFDKASHVYRAVVQLSQECAGLDVVDEEIAKQYKGSVEQLFADNGLEEVPASVLVPDYSDADQYATEAQDKALNMLQRAGVWLIDMMKKIGQAIIDLIDKFKGMVGHGKWRVQALANRLKALKSKGATVSTEAGVRGVPVADVELIGDGGSRTIQMVKQAQDNTRKAGTETLAILRSTMDIFKEFKPGEHVDDKGSQFVVDQLVGKLHLTKASSGYERELPIGPANSVLIQLTEGHNGRISAKVGAKPYVKKAGSLPGMSGDDCERLLETLTAFYTGFDSMKAPMDQAARVFKQMADPMNGRFKEEMTKATKATDIQERRTCAVAAQTYAMFATILTQLGRLPRENLSAYMKTQWAVEKYLDGCIDLLEGRKAA